MAFTVEDGTGLVNANAYISVSYADTYFNDRLATAWTASTLAKQSAIVKATDYIETVFGPRMVGRVAFPETPQALSFPRLRVFNKSGIELLGIPENLKKATAEYALRALTLSLMPDPVVSDSGFSILSKTETVGPITEKTDYQISGVNPKMIKPYPAADKLLSEFILPIGGNYR
jgi:hypothetical protein